MKKIMFNDKYGLTQAVLEGKKTQTRRICRIQPPYEYFDIAFPCLWINEDNPENAPLYGAFCWVNKITPQEHTDWVRPQYKIGEVVAVAQSYKDASNWALVKDCREFEGKDPWLLAGWNNKMFVKAELMPHQIRITNVRIQRLQDISDEDCLAEGIQHLPDGGGLKPYAFYDKSIKVKSEKEGVSYGWYRDFDTPREAYAALIDKISGKGTWKSNPWVWAYTFELVK